MSETSLPLLEVTNGDLSKKGHGVYIAEADEKRSRLMIFLDKEVSGLNHGKTSPGEEM